MWCLSGLCFPAQHFRLAKLRFVVQALPLLQGCSVAQYVAYQATYRHLYRPPARIHALISELMTSTCAAGAVLNAGYTCRVPAPLL